MTTPTTRRGPRYTPTGVPLIELSVVMPCLNEADTLATCVDKAIEAMRSRRIRGEVIVADNGSTDGSQEIAAALGARVVPVSQKGYGNALMGGIAAARGKYVIMGDADDSYDFLEIPKFVAKLREGYDLVQGCRLPSRRRNGDAGRHAVSPSLVRQSHVLVAGARLVSGARCTTCTAACADSPRAIRATRPALHRDGVRDRDDHQVEPHRSEVAEVPITLHPDGRKAHAPHLRTFRDGWRTLRFFLLYSPRWLFLVPGALLMVLGAIGYGVALPGVTHRARHVRRPEHVATRRCTIDMRARGIAR